MVRWRCSFVRGEIVLFPQSKSSKNLKKGEQKGEEIIEKGEEIIEKGEEIIEKGEKRRRERRCFSSPKSSITITHHHRHISMPFIVTHHIVTHQIEIELMT